MSKHLGIKHTFVWFSLFALFLFPTLAVTQPRSVAAQAPPEPLPQDYMGIVHATPVDGKLGEWQIGDLAFITDGQTQFIDPVPTVDECAKLTFVALMDQNLIQVLSPADGCDAPEPPPTDPDPTIREFYGIVRDMPADGFVGIWTIDDQTFVVSDTTEIGEPTPILDSCVVVAFTTDPNGQHLALKIAVSDTCPPPPESVFHGIVQEKPEDGLVGEWTIGDQTFVVSDTTEFGEEIPEVGLCVEVVSIPQEGSTVVVRMSVSELCNLDDPPGDGEEPEDPANYYHGLVQAMPEDGLIGEWKIGDRPFSTDETTEFGDELPFVGACVNLLFTELDGEHLVLKMVLSDQCQGTEPLPGIAFGVVEEVPTGLVGEWKISGETYLAKPMTWFSQPAGPLVSGACVKVRYVTLSEGNVAFAIQTSDEEACQELPRETMQRVAGMLESFPEGLIGTWTVSGETYEVSTTTKLELDQEHFFVGACVEIIYDPASATRLAYHVESSPFEACETEATPPPGPVEKTTGLIAQMPEDGMFGTWKIGEESYQAVTGTTTFNWEHGQIAVGQCAVVVYSVVDSTNVYTYELGNVALHIGSLPPFECAPHDDEHDVMFGIIRSLPETDTLSGTWVIGEQSFEVTKTTELEGEAFEVGMFVKVKFVHAEDGTLVATLIKAEHQENEDEHGEPRIRAKAYGLIEKLPTTADLMGNWTIGGTVYQVTPYTRLKAKQAAFALTGCVEVHYRTAADGTRTAGSIKARPATRCAPDTENTEARSRAFGFVEQMPPSGFVGTWVVGGVSYEAETDTHFVEEEGTLGGGTFVGIVYRVVDGVNVIHRIMTFVPPGAGDEDTTGTLETGEDDQANIAADTGTETWLIGGQAYTINDATLLDETQAELVDGQTVQVNAYEDSAGNRVATQITAVQADRTIYLPLIRR